MFRTAQTGSANRNLLPVHHTIAVLFSPAVGATLRVLLMTLSRQVPHFFLNHQVHQSQSGLAQQVADSFLQQATTSAMGKIIWMLGFSSRASLRNRCTARC